MGKHSREQLINDRLPRVPSNVQERGMPGAWGAGWDTTLQQHRPTIGAAISDFSTRTTLSDLYLSIRHSYGRGRA